MYQQNIKKLVAIVFLALFTIAVESAEPIRVMSFNIRYGSARDGDNRWDLRKQLAIETIEEFGPDLLCTQETLDFQAQYVKDKLNKYSYFGRSREKAADEHCGIFYRQERFTWLAGGYFWLSNRPDSVGSKGWDAVCSRMVTWVVLVDALGDRPILLLNTHFDHKGVKARVNSAHQIVDWLPKLKAIANNCHVIVAGDFNTGEGSEPYRIFVSDDIKLYDSYRKVHPIRHEHEGTFNSFQYNRTQGQRIDWILLGDTLETVEAEILRTERDKKYPSDHFPVTAVVYPINKSN